MILCICLSLQLWVQWFALWPQFSERSKRLLVYSAFYLLLGWSDDLQAHYRPDRKPEVSQGSFILYLSNYDRSWTYFPIFLCIRGIWSFCELFHSFSAKFKLELSFSFFIFKNSSYVGKMISSLWNELNSLAYIFPFVFWLYMWCVCVLSCFSYVGLFVTLWTIACQAPLSMGFSRKEYWSGLLCPPSGNLSDPGIEPVFLMSPALAGSFFALAPPGKPTYAIFLPYKAFTFKEVNL